MTDAEKIRLQAKWQKKILLFCWLTYALSYFCRTNLSIALPKMSETFHWSTTSAGMIGSAFFLSYGLGHLINGMLGDKMPIKKFMLLGLFGTSFCNLLIGFFPYYGVITAVWMLNGFFLSTLWGPIMRAMAMWYAPEDRNPPAIIISFSSLAGYLVSWAGLGVLIEFTSWKGAFFLPGLITLAFTIWFAVGMNDRPQEMGLDDFTHSTLPGSMEGSQEASRENYSLSFWGLIKKEHLLCFCLAAIAQGIIKDGITLCEPSILSSLHHASSSVISLASSLIPVFSFVGVLLSGKLMNRYLGKEKRPGIILFAGTGIFCLFFYFLLGKSLWSDVLFFGLISALLSGINTLLLTFIPLRLAKFGYSSSVAGIFNFCAYLGAGCSGILSGALVDGCGWSSTILLWFILCAVGAAAVLLGFRRKKERAALSHMPEKNQA